MSEKTGLGPGTLLTSSGLGEISLRILGGNQQLGLSFGPTLKKEEKQKNLLIYMEIEMKEVRSLQWKATLRDKGRIQNVEHGCMMFDTPGRRGGKMRLWKWMVAES